ncbi:FprA family A-type flavoprotein [Candidatus Margulisiibacteriota bacterium]
MQNIELKKDIYWVGGIDWDLRSFHGYLTQRGTTYNSYLIIDEKITLIDTVKYYLVDEMLERISQIIDPAKIDYVISNHVEMDHSGGLPRLMELCPNATVVCSPKGEAGLKAHYKPDWNFKVVDTGDSLSIGRHNLQFVATPMVHWPDNMVTYCPEEKLLFSNDGFGQHIASDERFDDEYKFGIVMEEAKKYYANIVLPYGAMVQKELEAASTLDIEMIAPSHGIILRSHIPEMIEAYKKWSANEIEKKAVIVYDTMWHSTEKIAKALYNIFKAKEYNVVMYNLQHIHISDVMTDVLDAEYICVGSPTLNNNMMPHVSAFLTYMKGLAPKNRKGMAFGSYGWGGQSVGQIEAILKESGFEMLEQVRMQYIPDQIELGEKVEKSLCNS